MAIRLFEPLELRGVALQNRIVFEPMTQFSSKDEIKELKRVKGVGPN